MKCELCRTRPKDWNGDDRKCFFDGHGLEHNWMCATVNDIRKLVDDEWGQKKLPNGVHIWRNTSEERSYAVISVHEVEGPEGWSIGSVLFVEWYKDRGNTAQLQLLSSEPPRVPTEDELRRILAFYTDPVEVATEADYVAHEQRVEERRRLARLAAEEES